MYNVLHSPDACVLEGQIETFGDVGQLLLYLLESGQQGVLSLAKCQLHFSAGNFTFVAHPWLQQEAAIMDILERRRGSFYVLDLPICREFCLPAKALIVQSAVSLDTQAQQQPNLQAEVLLPNLESAVVYARAFAPLSAWEFGEDSLRLHNPPLLLKIQSPPKLKSPPPPIMTVREARVAMLSPQSTPVQGLNIEKDPRFC